ncbi:hypothetical protein IEO21_10615 [Rhodonia placenta]|nr:hypothetical protein IEO21_10615 [Postia placenta]
MEASQK